MSDWFREHRIAWIVEIVQIYEFINRKHVEKKFNISSPQATLDLKEVQKRFPELIVYDSKSRKYCLKNNIAVNNSSGDLDES